LPILVRIWLGGLLSVAGALKLRAPAEFATEIANYQLAPAIAPYLAATLPVIEMVVGLGLLVFPRRWRRAASAVALGLFGMFLFAVTSALVRHVNIACGCFGAGGGPINGGTVARNLGLTIVAAGLLGLDRERALARD
jgi:uncharacterized protein YjeT (DUF2065 family)